MNENLIKTLGLSGKEIYLNYMELSRLATAVEVIGLTDMPLDFPDTNSDMSPEEELSEVNDALVRWEQYSIGDRLYFLHRYNHLEVLKLYYHELQLLHEFSIKLTREAEPMGAVEEQLTKY